MQTAHRYFNSFPVLDASDERGFAGRVESAGQRHMTGLIRNNRGKMPLRGGAAGLVWGRPAPLPFDAAALTQAQSMFAKRFADETPRGSHARLNAGKEIRRIEGRSERMLHLLIALWVFICLFVLLAMGLHWKL